MKIDVDVIIRSHGDSQFLLQAIDSVQKQVFTGELKIHVSTLTAPIHLRDSLEELHRQASICLHVCDRAGYAYPLNLMLDCSSGLYVAILDHDDLMNRNRIQIQFDFLEKNREICAVGSSIRLINSLGEVIGHQVYESNPQKVRKVLLHKTSLAHPSAMIRRSAINKVGGYRDFYDTAEDFDLWLRLSEFCNLSNLVENLTDYRLHESQVTSTSRYRNLTASSAAMQSARLRKKGLAEIHDRYKSPQSYGGVFSIRVKLNYRIYCEKLLRNIRTCHLIGRHSLALYYFVLLLVVSPRQGIWALRLGFRSLNG